MFLYGELKDCYDWSKDTPDALLLTLHSTIEEAKYSGIVKCDDHNIVQSISFKKDRDDTVTVVGGVVFLRTSVAETLLALYTRPPLDRCTYLGVDNGEQPLNVCIQSAILKYNYINTKILRRIFLFSTAVPIFRRFSTAL